MSSVGSDQVSLTPQQRASVDRLEHKFVAPCCYSQVLADHLSGEAATMRNEVVSLVSSGKSEQQITDYYKAKYGLVILAAPDGPWGTVAFVMPSIVGSLGVLLLVLFIKGKFSKQPTASLAVPAGSLALAPHALIERIRRETEEI